MTKKVLFIAPLPPPNIGAALSGQMCLNILHSKGNFKVKYVKYNFAKTIKDIGVYGPRKIIQTFNSFFVVLWHKVFFNPDFIYFVPATADMGLVRDSFMIKLLYSKRAKLILHLRTTFIQSDFESKIQRRRINSLLNVDSIILLGKELVENLNGFGKNANIVVLPNAIEKTISETQFAEIMEAKKQTNSKLRLLFLSNMIESKGWMKTLIACSLLKKQNIPFYCNFVGEWQNREDLNRFNKFCYEHQLNDCVKQHGALIGASKNAMFVETDILIFPTEYKVESFGRVIIEAQEYGIPCIANNIASIPSIIDVDQNGFLLNPNTPDEIAKYVIQLSDKQKRVQMGYAARSKFLANYTMEVFTPKFLNIFK